MVWEVECLPRRVGPIAKFRTIIFAVIFSPYRVAFFNNSDDAWMGIEIALDLIFLVDLIFNFITAYFDNEENLIDN